MTAATGLTTARPASATASIGSARAGLLSFAAALWAAFERARDHATATASLNRLDDRALKDIGLHRTEITSMVHFDLQDPSRRPR